MTAGVPGIRSKTAEKIAKHFGDSLVEVISETPERLSEVPGLGARGKKAAEFLRENNEIIFSVHSWLMGLGLTALKAEAAINMFGPTVRDEVNANPYILWKIKGIGFAKADSIAMTINPDMSQNPRPRVCAAVRYVLEELEKNQSTAASTDVLRQNVLTFLKGKVSQKRIDEILDDPQSDHSFDFLDIVRHERKMALKHNHSSEEYVSLKLNELQSADMEPLVPNAAEFVQAYERKNNLQFEECQANAIKLAAGGSAVMVLDGLPGTGKTTVARSIVDLWTHKGLRVAACAPTGLAAKKLSKSIGRYACTIHRLLSAGYGGFAVNEHNPLQADAVVVDETSMVDSWLMSHLCRALLPGTRLLLIGDRHQIPSVGAGEVLRDVTSSGLFAHVSLTKIHRQARNSQIIYNARRVNEGKPPIFDNSHSDDYYFFECGYDREVRATVEGIASTVQENFGLDPMSDVQVLTPMHGGECGTIALNELMHETCNPREDGYIATKYETLCMSDRVMQTENNYDLGVYNGDAGVITSLDPTSKRLTVKFDDFSVDYDSSNIGALRRAYTTTIHKSQGSEFPMVVVVMMRDHHIMLNRRLLYTAMTRARDHLVLVGHKGAFAMAARNDVYIPRTTMLQELLWQNNKESQDGRNQMEGERD